jgi:hypothetical protein
VEVSATIGKSPQQHTCDSLLKCSKNGAVVKDAAEFNDQIFENESIFVHQAY